MESSSCKVFYGRYRFYVPWRLICGNWSTTHKHLLIVLVGLVYILEALSVVIQVTYFKITARQHYKKTGEKGKGKRIFKMSPIHHHFEMCGFSEYKIVITFSVTAIIVSALGILTVI